MYNVLRVTETEGGRVREGRKRGKTGLNTTEHFLSSHFWKYLFENHEC